VWRRRLYTRRYMVVSQVASSPSPVVVTTQTGTARGPGYVSF
jgi:hypothetical protein